MICNTLRDLVPFAQFQKREKHAWRSFTFSKVAGLSNSPPCVFFTFLKFYKWYQIAQSVTLKNSFSVKMLGLTKENNFDLNDHIFNTFKTGNQKLTALFRVSAGMNSVKCSLLIIFFIKSHFSYCPLISGCSAIKKMPWKKSTKYKIVLYI